MSSPEFQQQLQESKEFRKNEAAVLLNMRRSGLRTEAWEYLQSLRQGDAYIQARRMVWFERWEKLGEKIPEFTKEQWEETGQVLSGLNNGVKAGLFLTIAQNTSPNTYMPTNAVVERFKEMFAGTELLEALSETKKTRSQVILYCQDSLCDVGLLAEEYATDEWGVKKIVGFCVTERGRRIGIFTALSILWYENKAHTSLYPVFGQTASPGETRAPFNRVRVLDYMCRHPYEVREADLVTAVGLEHSLIAGSFHSLSNYEMIDYKSVTSNTGRTQIRYKVVESKDPAKADYYQHYPSLQEEIIKILKESTEPISALDISEKLPDQFKQNWNNKKRLKSHISEVLSDLSRQNYLARVDRFTGAKKQSDVSLTIKGRDLYFQVLYPTLLLSSGRSLSGNYLFYIEKSNKGLASCVLESAEMYYPYSTSSKRSKYPESILQVFEILQDNPDSSFTAQELAEKMELSTGTIKNYLKPQIPRSNEATFYLEKETMVVIQREKIKGVWYFRVKKPAEQSESGSN